MSESIEQQAQQFAENTERDAPCVAAMIRALLAELARVRQERERLHDLAMSRLRDIVDLEHSEEQLEVSLASVRAALGEIEQEMRAELRRVTRIRLEDGDVLTMPILTVSMWLDRFAAALKGHSPLMR
jgi:hypothetical protein